MTGLAGINSKLVWWYQCNGECGVLGVELHQSSLRICHQCFGSWVLLLLSVFVRFSPAFDAGQCVENSFINFWLARRKQCPGHVGGEYVAEKTNVPSLFGPHAGSMGRFWVCSKGHRACAISKRMLAFLPPAVTLKSTRCESRGSMTQSNHALLIGLDVYRRA